jgi:hypothetical protein
MKQKEEANIFAIQLTTLCNDLQVTKPSNLFLFMIIVGGAPPGGMLTDRKFVSTHSGFPKANSVSVSPSMVSVSNFPNPLIIVDVTKCWPDAVSYVREREERT